MQKFVYLFMLSLILESSDAQTGSKVIRPFSPKITYTSFKLGERLVQVQASQYGSSREIICVNLHDDEVTSVTSAKKLLERQGGLLIRIENSKGRNIRFKLGGQSYTFDPNRMFSRDGIHQSLLVHGRSGVAAVNEVEKFANFMLALIPRNAACIIALHNNTNGKFSISSYLPGNIRENDAKQMYINPEEDPDDVFLTTDSLLFRKLAEDNYNVVWQDNKNAKKDGSLSIYCGENNIRYVNCETEHGRDIQYQQMIMVASNHITAYYKSSHEVIAYNYKLVSSTKGVPKSNTDIMFGEKKVGLIRSVATDSSWATIGKIEMSKDFPLYSNMDFLFYPNPSSPRFEVRIDPTRAREPLDPRRSTVHVRAVN